MKMKKLTPILLSAAMINPSFADSEIQWTLYDKENGWTMVFDETSHLDA